MANGGDFIRIMADKPQKRPSKGILKTSTSFEKPEKTAKKNKPKATKWDEMNIIATLHPADKDYGHMKIEEPKTPYAWDVGDEEDDDVDGQGRHMLDPEELAEKLKGNLDRSPRRDAFERDSDDSDADLTAEELARRKVFKSKRKMHYNEFKVVEFARKLIKADEEALENDESDDRPTSSTKSPELKPETTGSLLSLSPFSILEGKPLAASEKTSLTDTAMDSATRRAPNVCLCTREPMSVVE